MEVDDLVEVLESGSVLPVVLRSLGLDCLSRIQELENDRYAALADSIRSLRSDTAAESIAMWRRNGEFETKPTATLKDRIAKARITPALATATVLEGLCLGAGRVFFANASTVVRIERGDVFPLPERWIPEIAHTPPNPTTTHPNLLVEWSNFVLWESDWVIELDYTYRERLDQVCAVRIDNQDKFSRDGSIKTLAYRLPKIATVHPFGGDNMDLPNFDDDRMRFFGVYPKLPLRDSEDEQITLSRAREDELKEETHRRVFTSLARVGTKAPIAVLPEYCLHSPDGLDELLKSSDLPLPSLIVAGSAHTPAANEQERANTSHVFLDQHRILTVSKTVPFVIRGKDDEGFPIHYAEDLSPLPRALRLLAGSATRLAIVICSDLNSTALVSTMALAGVNLMLAPTWTPKVGGFPGGLELLANTCQCVSVISNTPGHELTGEGELFWAYSMVPRVDAHAKRHVYEGDLPAAGVLDPNLSPQDSEYWNWLDSEEP